MAFFLSPLPFYAENAVFQLLFSEYFIAWPCSLPQFIADLLRVYSRVAIHRVCSKLPKSRLCRHGENIIEGWQTRRLNGGNLRKKAKGHPLMISNLWRNRSHEEFSTGIQDTIDLSYSLLPMLDLM